ncbi:MAG TPA: hypothetical protein VFJ97_06570 [Dermatophilaceae bacterium]|nr:hypothetical protein [Dermatophilaceae bacterium]
MTPDETYEEPSDAAREDATPAVVAPAIGLGGQPMPVTNLVGDGTEDAAGNTAADDAPEQDADEVVDPIVLDEDGTAR